MGGRGRLCGDGQQDGQSRSDRDAHARNSLPFLHPVRRARALPSPRSDHPSRSFRLARISQARSALTVASRVSGCAAELFFATARAMRCWCVCRKDDRAHPTVRSASELGTAETDMVLRTMLIALFGLLASGVAEARTYDLVIERQRLEVEPGRRDNVITVNGSLPGPVLRFTEGERATIRVTNRMKERTAIHWHGLLLPGDQDGAPGFNGFPGIDPGQTFTYTFDLRQTGTYWYHAHSATQEQIGEYGAFVIEPRGAPAQRVDREHVVVLSEHTREDPERILRNLKGDAGYYNFSRRTLPDLFADARKFGWKRTLADRRAWGRMRMDPTDIADVGNYTLLVNGKPTAAKPWLELRAGERVRLRFVNGSAMSFMDVRTSGLPMTVVAADGRAVEPVLVDEFRIGVAETYDVIVEPKEDGAYPLYVETLDRKASVLATLASSPTARAAVPGARPRPVLLMSEMGHAMGDMAMGGPTPAAPGGAHAGHRMSAAMNGAPIAAARSDGTDHARTGSAAPRDTMTDQLNQAAARQPQPMEEMDHGAMTGMNHDAPQPRSTRSTPNVGEGGMDHSTMPGMSDAQTARVGGSDSAAQFCAPEHAAMGHCERQAAAPADTPMIGMPGMDHATDAAPPGAQPTTSTGVRIGTAVSQAVRPAGGTPFPTVNYGFGADPMAGMDMAGMGHGGMSHASMQGMSGMSETSGMSGMGMPALAREGDLDGSGRVFGWSSGAPYGARVLSVRDLRAAEPQRDTRAPVREIVVKVSGNMERYIWTLNGAKFGEAPPIRVKYGDRVRVTFVNETMMAHPMHLHGMFFQVENGQPIDRLPDKNVIAVAPGRTQSVLVTADEAGEWPLHCHLLYHMESGMMQKFIVATVDNPDGTPAAPGAHASHGAH
ncbi:multicopper oxidase domain-containing protein [Sphingomonas lenta]|uniref:multicopper oxidase domain-containing protein n=1 Tax=Sphingomonas lenta TaxID=1141887 RepID=UPI0015951B9C|nr:multicopper oxidase domain-containing protein [Sphingomonas lenta]